MLINDHFVIDLLRNEITNKQTGEVSHVEPRLIKLLCLLTEYQGKAVSRKTIVKEIWNDYPGGDEGLNQAISVLRKLLDDDKKKIIETLPKTGYCFHGKIGHEQIAPKRKSFKKIYVSAAVVLLLPAAFALGYYSHPKNDKIVPGKLSREQIIKASRIDSKTDLDNGEKDRLDSMDKRPDDRKN